MYAQALATNGAKVYITGRRQETLETSARIHGAPDKIGNAGGQIVPLVMDVTDKESIKKAVEHIQATDGYVNMLVPITFPYPARMNNNTQLNTSKRTGSSTMPVCGTPSQRPAQRMDPRNSAAPCSTNPSTCGRRVGHRSSNTRNDLGLHVAGRGVN